MTEGPTPIDVILERLQAIRESQDEIKSDLRAFRTQYVPLALWEQRNKQVDDRFQGHGREIGGLRTEIQTRRVPWTAVGSFVVAGAALLITLIERLVG